MQGALPTTRALQGVIFCASLSWTVSCGSQVAYGQGQSFLEKLEAAVREQLQQDGSKEASEELPPPKSKRVTSTQASPPDSAADLPSILEKPLNPPAVAPANPGPATPGASPGGPADSQSGDAGRIYLGLEAEEPVGGGIGVRVSSVTEQSPAWKAGFRLGDRILAINGFAIANLNGMVEQLSKTLPGQSVRFLASRGGRNIELTSVLMDAELASRIQGASAASESTPGRAWLGVVVNDLTASFRQQFGITVFRGAAVTNVAAGSPAAKADIRAGDAIIEVSGRPIERAADLMAWVAQARPGENAELMVYRGGQARAVQLTLQVDPKYRESRPMSRRPPTDAAALPNLTVPPPLGAAELPPGTSPSPPADLEAAPVTKMSRAELEREVARLSAELRQAQKRLDDTQQRLNQILESLRLNNP